MMNPTPNDPAAVANGLVADDGERQCWATIRSGLGAGLQERPTSTPAAALEARLTTAMDGAG